MINKIGTSKTEEDVFNMLSLEPGRMTYANDQLYIYDADTDKLKLMIFLPKCSKNPKTNKEDGLKHVLIGEGNSKASHVLRIRYHTGNWLFIQIKGSKSKKKTEHLVREYRRCKERRLETFELIMGKKAEYEEMDFHLKENYEKIRIQYTKPRVFGLEKLPYQKYYAWLKYEKDSRHRRVRKEVVIKRKRSLDYFKPSVFEKFMADNNFDSDTRFEIVDDIDDSVPADDESVVSLLGPDLSGTCALMGNLPRVESEDDVEEIKPKMDESMDVFDIYNPSKDSLKKLRVDLPKLTLGLKPRGHIQQHETGTSLL